MHHVQRRFPGRAVERTPQALAVNRYHTLQTLGEALHEAHETGLERLGIEPAEHPAEGVVAGDAVLQTQELAQERPFGPAKGLHVGAVFATAQHAAEGDDQNLVKVVADVILPGVGDLGETRDELFHAGAPGLNPSVGIQSGAAPQA